MKQSKPDGFVSRLGQRAIRGWERFRRGLAAMWKAHQNRGWWERSLVGVVAAGLIVGVGFALLGNLPFGAVPHGGEIVHDRAEIAPDPSQAAGVPPIGTEPEIGLSSPLPSPPLQTHTVEDVASASDAESASEGPALSPEGPSSPPQAPVSPRTVSSPSPADIPVTSISSMEWPVIGGVLRPYGWYRHPVFGDWRHASSVTIQPAADHNVVTAALAGRVTDVVNAGGLWRVTIRHADGWETEYEGLASVDVASYEVVATGQVIGSAPDSPVGAVAFAVYRDGIAVDPSEILGEPTAVATAP